MIRCLFEKSRRFAAEESGTAAVSFALWVPLFVAIIVSGVELGVVTARHTVLERALDETVREVRLGTGTLYDGDSLTASICDKATILPACTENLQLEMVKLDIRDWTAPPAQIQCVDTGAGDDDVKPKIAFEYGRENELMMLRACYKYEPISPLVGLGKQMTKDANGYTGIVSKAAFVHEPI